MIPTPPNVAEPEFSADVAIKEMQAADDAFLARERRRTRRWRVILIVSLLVAIHILAGIYLGPSLLPEPIGPLKTAYGDLVRLQKEIESNADIRADRAQWIAYSNTMSPRLRNAIRPIATSKHPIHSRLISARTDLHKALRAQTQEDFDRTLQHAGRKLNDAKMKLGL